MARSRSLKPDFWTSPQINRLSEGAALSFCGLWNYADCHGIHSADAERLKMEIAPGRPDVTHEVLSARIVEMIEQGLVREYEVDGETYWIITGWAKHQYPWKPHYRYPLPPDYDEAPAKGGQRPATVATVSDKVKVKDSNTKDTNKDKKAPPAGGTLGRFKDVSDVYPAHRKKNLATARTYWAKHHCDAIADTIVADVIERQAKDVDWLRGAIPHLPTYINQRRWNDPIEEESHADRNHKDRQGGRRGPETTQDRIKRANPGAFKSPPAATVTPLRSIPADDDWPEEA